MRQVALFTALGLCACAPPVTPPGASVLTFDPGTAVVRPKITPKRRVEMQLEETDPYKPALALEEIEKLIADAELRVELELLRTENAWLRALVVRMVDGSPG